MDTDSIFYEIPMPATESDAVILANQAAFDSSEYSDTHLLKYDINKRVPVLNSVTVDKLMHFSKNFEKDNHCFVN